MLYLNALIGVVRAGGGYSQARIGVHIDGFVEYGKESICSSGC